MKSVGRIWDAEGECLSTTVKVRTVTNDHHRDEST